MVVDASCLVVVLLGAPGADAVAAAFLAERELVAPHLVDVEVLGVIRRAHRRGLVDGTAATQAVEDLESWPATRVDHRPLIPRAWELRDVLSAPDACYVALAEMLEVPLLTLDQQVAHAPGIRCDVQVPPQHG